MIRSQFAALIDLSDFIPFVSHSSQEFQCKYKKNIFSVFLFMRARPISLDTFVLSYIHSQESRIFDYEVPLAAKNENMATGSEPAVEREWM